MSVATKTSEVRVDQFFTGAEARFDRWRSLLQSARAWERAGSQQPPEKEKYQAVISASLAELRQWEDFFAYPGHTLLRTLSERVDSGDATGTVRLAQTISGALLTHSYRANMADWEGEDQSPISFSERVPGGGEETASISKKLVRSFLDDLAMLPIALERFPAGVVFDRIQRLSRDHGLTTYDAAYLDLALDSGLPLATLDEDLARASKKARVRLVHA